MFKKCAGVCITRRLRSTLKENDGFLVLPAKASGILPKKRPEKKKRGHQMDDLAGGFDLKILEPTENQQVLKNIEGLKPASRTVSQHRYEDIHNSLTKGYKKQQLKEYLGQNGVQASSSATKSKMAAMLLKKVWKLEVSQQVADYATTSEYTLDLNERDFMLLIGKNGQQLREWAKSGASIRVNPTKCQFLIRCTPVTFDWISASMHYLLDQSIRHEKVDLSEMQKLSTLTPQQLKIIQYLTNTYFEQTGDDRLVIYSLDKIGIVLAKQYLLQLIPCPPEWVTSTYFYDVDQTNLPEYHWAENADYAALEWYKKGAPYFRWEQVKKKIPPVLNEPQYQQLSPAEFNDTGSLENVSGSKDSIRKLIAERIKAKESFSVTATLGYLLHHKGNEYVPNLAQTKIFNTNVPLVKRFGGQLGAYAMDTVQEVDEVNQVESLDEMVRAGREYSSTPASVPQSEDDVWSSLLDEKTFVHRPSETAAPSIDHSLRIKFVPSIAKHGARAVKEHPPVEIWCPLAHEPAEYVRRGNEISLDSVLAFKLSHEYHDYVSLPGMVSDLRFTSSVTDQLDLDNNIRDFVKKCAVTKSGPMYIYHEVDIDGVTYEYSESSFLTISELNYNGTLLQITSSDGGNAGGRRIEANLVLTQPLEDEPANVQKFVDEAFNFVKQVGKTRVALDKL